MKNVSDSMLADLFISISKLTFIDKKMKKGKKFNSVCNEIATLLNTLMPFENEFIFETKDGKITFDNNKTIAIPDSILKSDNLAAFKSALNQFWNSVFRRFINDRISECSESTAEIVDISQDINQMIDFDSVRTSTRVNKIKKAIEKEKPLPLLVYGNSSSGKTTAVAQAIILSACSYTWIDLNDVNVEIEHFVYSILSHIATKRHVIIIDNVQSHPSKIEWIKKAIDQISSLQKQSIFVTINICWRSAKETVAKMYYPQPVQKMECYGDDIIIEFIRENALEKYEKDIIGNSVGDVLVASRMISYILENGSCPSERKLSQTIFKEFTKSISLSHDAKNVLYVLAALGEFEIHVQEGYLKKYSEQGYSELRDNRLFRLYKTEDNDAYISIGHRSLAHSVLIHLQNTVTIESSPIKLAIEYLTIEGESQILSTLERLDLELEIGDSIFANLWQAFGNMRDSLIKQLSVDITWGNNMASMIFAVEALSKMKFLNEAEEMTKKTGQEIRKRWSTSDGNTGLIFIGMNNDVPLTSEIVDFEENIRRCMEVDEKTYAYSENMLAQKIDYKKFHDNWLLGLLLGFEAEYDTCSEKVNNYIKCAENVQDLNGSFYPMRVCWVTARVIMGLAKCGLSYSDKCVKKACNWLVEQLIEPKKMYWTIDNLKCYGWRSGTGTWNSNEQITLMCICALFEAKYPVHQNEKTYQIVSEFWRCRNELEQLFTEKGTVLDIMWIIDVMLYDNRNPIEMKEEVRNLTKYVLEKWSSASLLSTEKETESSDVSFMAKELICIVWELLNKNIDLLLKGLELKYTISGNGKRIFISYRREEGGGSAFAQNIYNALDQVYKNDCFLDVYDLHGECDEFDIAISQALSQSQIVIAIITDHVFERACSENYNNQNDVFFKELDNALKQNKKVIAIYNSSVKHPECPDALKVNPEFYQIAQALSKKNAVFYDATIPDAMVRLTKDIVAKINQI